MPRKTKSPAAVPTGLSCAFLTAFDFNNTLCDASVLPPTEN